MTGSKEAMGRGALTHPQLQALYQRLVSRGKSHKQAMVACARKLLIFANAVVARDALWQIKPAA